VRENINKAAGQALAMAHGTGLLNSSQEKI